MFKLKKIPDNFIMKIGERILHKNEGDHKIVRCPICNREIVPYWEPRYNGVRASCSVCGTNWQES